MPEVEIRRNEDGVVRVYHDSYPWEAGSEYLWADGNYSCDCNRELHFWRAGGKNDPDIEGAECGDGKYSVRITENGDLLYQDGVWDTLTPAAPRS